ncbi:MAG TPA: hypothetical protein VKZ60_07595 [Chloroflexota bacterium]|jgi:hypothetical protein|nr:hypothetical protein [Chloroflexota bacterium]
MNERDWIWAEWLLGVFGTATLFVGLAMMGSAAQGEFMGWLGWATGTLAFAIVPWAVVALRPRQLTGGLMGVGISIGALALILILASLYDVTIPPLVVPVALVLGFFSGALGEPALGASWR